MLQGWTLLTIFLYVIGLFLLLVEALVPGFGIAGVSGIVCVIASIIMISHNVMEALLILVTTTIAVALVIALLVRLGYANRFFKHMVLKSEQKNSEGYTSTEDLNSYLGKTGKAITVLRPAGTIEIGKKLLDAVTEGGFIEKDSAVEVVRIEGRRIMVRKIVEENK